MLKKLNYRFLFYIFKLLGVDDMVAVYATLIVNGKKKFDEVPVTLKDKVKEYLINLDVAFLIEE